MSSSPHLFQGVKQLLPYVVKSSKGVHVETECGKKFIDFTCGIGVTNLGHSHDAVNKAVIEAVPNLVHAQQNIMQHKPMTNLIHKLYELDISQRANLNSWFFWNSGSEAVEGAVKLARQATKKPNIIVAQGGYHGRTIGAMSLTTSGVIYRAGFNPLMSGVFVMPFPYLANGPYNDTVVSKIKGESPTLSKELMPNYWGNVNSEYVTMHVEKCLADVELMLKTQTAPSETAAILIEPVLGEGGYVPCPPGYLKGLRDICDKHEMLLICDEVQTGFGRTGHMFACDWIDGGIRPDVLICAKGIANGYPLSAVATRSELSAMQPGGSMGGTYGANALSCVAALAVMDTFHNENIIENVQSKHQELKKYLSSKLNPAGFAAIKEVRGNGLMIGVELNPHPTKSVGTQAKAVVDACVQNNLLILSCGPYDTIRLIPPLNITTQELQQGLDVFVNALNELTVE